MRANFGDENVPPLHFLSPEQFADFENADGFQSEFNLDVHGGETSNPLKSNRSNLVARQRFQCGKCFKTLTTREGLKNHLRRTHSNARDHKCKECDKTFKSQSNLCDHVRVVHRNVVFTCCRCDTVVNFRSNMKRHLSRHCSTKEELEAVWDEHYGTERAKQLVAAKKRYKDAADKAPVITDASTLELRPPPRNHRMKLGGFLTQPFFKYHSNMLYPKTPMSKLENMFHTDENCKSVFTPSFVNRECPLCPSLVLPRSRLLEHVEQEHGTHSVSESFCRICLKVFRDIDAHKIDHANMETAVQSMLSVTKNCLESVMDRSLFDEVAEMEKTRVLTM